MCIKPEMQDTIVAVATPPGKGGIGIVRVSGPDCVRFAKKLLKKPPPPRYATFTSFYDAEGKVIDKGIALYFPSPHSFTGEAVLELQGHGGPVVLDMVLQTLLRYGARAAQPGEFSKRAYLNGKINLLQAEAVADLIHAQSQQAAKSAVLALQGAFSDKVEQLSQALLHARKHVEAAIDFSEEALDFLSEARLLKDIQKIEQSIVALFEQAKRGAVLKEGVCIAIAGRPNAGKSSLLNALTAKETAIVTPVPGTTRDLIKETIQIEGVPIHLVDTAGIRSQGDAVEKIGIFRAREQLKWSDKILLVIDANQSPYLSEIESEILEEYKQKVIIVMNKLDTMSVAVQQVCEARCKNLFQTIPLFFLSAQTGEGLAILSAYLKQCGGGMPEGEGVFMARRRHIDALNRAQKHIQQAVVQCGYRALELVAQELYFAQEMMEVIIGKVTPDEVLGEIFSSFCIGK